MVTPMELLVLSLLANKPAGAYGSELFRASEGKLKRGSIYTLLTRLEKSGFVTSTEEGPTDQLALPRTRYRITAQGRQARNEFVDWHGLRLA